MLPKQPSGLGIDIGWGWGFPDPLWEHLSIPCFLSWVSVYPDPHCCPESRSPHAGRRLQDPRADMARPGRVQLGQVRRRLVLVAVWPPCVRQGSSRFRKPDTGVGGARPAGFRPWAYCLSGPRRPLPRGEGAPWRHRARQLPGTRAWAGSWASGNHSPQNPRVPYDHSLDVLGAGGLHCGGGELGSGDMTARSVRYSTCIGTLCQFILDVYLGMG